MFDKFVVHSESEGGKDSNSSFWSNTKGWTNLLCATVFSIEERQTYNLPVTQENDAHWMPVAHAYNPSLISFNEVTELSVEEIALCDAIEIQGVREGDGYCEVCNENPEFFSTYVHLIAGGCQCVGDFGSYAKARAHAETLSKRHDWPIYSYVPKQFTFA